MADRQPTKSKIDTLLQELFDTYAKIVRNNPDTVSQIESVVRIASFIVAGRFQNGDLISELFYSGSNLLVFLNDNVFRAASKLVLNVEKLRNWLTVLEYVEVFLEMAARRKWGTNGSWVVITVVQITKTVLRLYLLLKMKGGIVSTPAVLPVDREVLKASQEQADDLENAWDEETTNSAPEQTFTLKSSGRQMRTLHAAGHNSIRNWGVPKNGEVSPQMSMLNMKRKLLNQSPSRLNKHRLWAECLHVARPLAHLMSMYICGQSSWKPWLVACAMDLSSQRLMGDVEDLNAREKAELKRRGLTLLYYLLRSPFYDTYTKSRIIAVLTFIANYVPLTGIIMRPLLEYLPTWQRMYFYVWAT